MLKNKKILIGITGGIAAYKVCSLIRELKKLNADVKTILTPNAKKFCYGNNSHDTLAKSCLQR